MYAVGRRVSNFEREESLLLNMPWDKVRAESQIKIEIKVSGMFDLY